MRGGLLAVLAVCLPIVVLEASPLGLIDQPQTFPWSVGLTPVVQEEAGGVPADQIRLRSSILWFNTYRQMGLDSQMTQLVDMEGYLGTVSGVWSPAAGWELRAQIQGWTLGGGILDPLLGGFHGLLAVPNQGREQRPEGEFHNYLIGEFNDSEPSTGLTQASGALRGFAGPWSWTTWVKVPVPGHQGWTWSDQWGWGLGAGWGDRWPWPEWGVILHGGLSAALVVVGDSEWPTGQTGFYTIVELPSGLRLLTQGSWTPVPRSGAGYLSQAAGLLTIGFQIPWTETDWTWEGALTEEFLTWATMEVGFQVGLVWHP